jgi:hypothetical protein
VPGRWRQPPASAAPLHSAYSVARAFASVSSASSALRQPLQAALIVFASAPLSRAARHEGPVLPVGTTSSGSLPAACRADPPLARWEMGSRWCEEAPTGMCVQRGFVFLIRSGPTSLWRKKAFVPAPAAAAQPTMRRSSDTHAHAHPTGASRHTARQPPVVVPIDMASVIPSSSP